MKSTRGFTVIELVIVITVCIVASVVFFVQKNHVEVAARDETRKTSINAIYYALEEVTYKQNKSYPRTLNAEVLASIDPEHLKDTNGVNINEGESEYRYEPLNCDGDACKSYTLRTMLENEDDYIKTSRNK